MLSSHSDAVKLLLDTRTYVAGDRVSGTVEFDHDKATKDGITAVRVKLRGVAKTYVVDDKQISSMLMNIAGRSNTAQVQLLSSTSPSLLWSERMLNCGSKAPPPQTRILPHFPLVSISRTISLALFVPVAVIATALSAMASKSSPNDLVC
jgi:hypothetical protein